VPRTEDSLRDRLISELEAGAVLSTACRSDPRLPFGGIKRSGYRLSSFKAFMGT